MTNENEYPIQDGYEWPEYIDDWKKALIERGGDIYSNRMVGCRICRHYNQETGYQCKAFPFVKLPNGTNGGGIPAPIHDGILIHDHSIDGDSGFYFEPLTPNERILLPKKDF